jgi:type I restriction enzyme S subunit
LITTRLELPVMSSWMNLNGRRLDCNPYLSGGFEARVLLEKMRAKKRPLLELTSGFTGGIYNGPQFVRNYVEDPRYGVPFLTSGSMLLADLSTVGLLRRKDAESSKLAHLRLEEGMTLISCSGTIGKTVYTRRDMEGMWSSQDVMKVVPDTNKIPSGYLYAYLSSKFGVPMIVSGTYGAIIQHIEPHHIASLPVPIAPESIQSKTHNLITLSAEKRAQANELLKTAQGILDEVIGLPNLPSQEAWRGYIATSSILKSVSRLDAFYHNPFAQTIENLIAIQPKGFTTLEAITENVFDVPPFKHIYVEAENGVPFFTSGDIFLLDRKTDKYLSKTQTRDLEKYILKQGWILLARSGQLGGIIGRPQFADSALHNAAASDHVIRIVPQPGKSTAGFLYTYLSSPHIGYHLLTRTMSGASIPALWPKHLKQIKIPLVSQRVQMQLDEIVTKAFGLRVEATSNEDEARLIVENFIEQV